MQSSDKSLKNTAVLSALSDDARYVELDNKYQLLKQRTKALTELSDTAAQMMRQNSLDKLLQFISNEIVRLTNANGAYLHMVHETGDFLKVIAACGALESQLMGNTRDKGIGLSAVAWETGEYQYTDNYNELSSRVVEFPEALKAVAIPLQFSNTIFGVAFITSSISEDLYATIPSLQEIAKVASLAIYYIKQSEAQASELQRIKALSGIGDTLYQSIDENSILTEVCEHLFDIFDIDIVSIYRASPEMGQLYSQCSLKKVNNQIIDAVSKPENIALRGINHWCYRNAKFAKIKRHIDDPRETAEVHQYRKDKRLGSTMCVPISNNEKPWGVILIAKNIDKCDFDESDANALQAVASQVSTAIQRNSALLQVKHQAFHDSLTELPNRRSFEAHFLKHIHEHENAAFAILFCDLDGFKSVNDSHGHNIGDKVINVCATRMLNCLREDDYLARMGGDEFAVLVSLNAPEYNIEKLARRLIDSVSEPINVSNIRVHIGASIGISFYPKDGKSFSDLLNHADVAMYQAKHSGKGKILQFNKKDSKEIRSRNELRADLQGALSRQEFELWYQPQVAWRTGKVVGVEALLRWKHPEKGMIPPYQFIPIAEQSGLIDPMGLWIMNEAASRLKALSGHVHGGFSMGVNIAPPQFIDPHFASKVFDILDHHSAEPEQLKVEITESFIMSERESVVKHLKHLRERGVVVAIDDFGTGYSSLSYLQDLPVDVLKIDRSFVCHLTDANYKKSIAASIIALSKSLGLSTITEGVETEDQLRYFKQLGSEVIQGYLYAKPVPANELLDVISRIESENTPKIKIA